MTKLLTATEVAELFSISRVHVWRRVKAGHLPAPIYPAPEAPRWRSDEIEAMFARASEARYEEALPRHAGAACSVVAACSTTLWSANRMASVRVYWRPGTPYCRLSVLMSASRRAQSSSDSLMCNCDSLRLMVVSGKRASHSPSVYPPSHTCHHAATRRVDLVAGWP